MRNLVFIRALRGVDGRGILRWISAQKQYLYSLYEVFGPVTICMHTRSRLLMSKPSEENQLTGQCAWNAWANKETNKSSAELCVISAIVPMPLRLSVALIVEFVHINVGRGAGLVLLCLSCIARWPHRNWTALPMSIHIWSDCSLSIFFLF